MLLLPAGDLAELFLRHARHEPLEPRERLPHILRRHDILLGPAHQLLDTQQAVPDQVLPEPLVHLLQHELPETVAVALLHLQHRVDVATLDELRRRDPLAHDQGLGRPRGAQAQAQRPRRPALGHEPERGERREEERVRRAIDEVRERADGRGEADHRPVEPKHEDLGVRRERVGDIEVVGPEVAEPVMVEILTVTGSCPRNRDVGAADAIKVSQAPMLQGTTASRDWDAKAGNSR